MDEEVIWLQLMEQQGPKIGWNEKGQSNSKEYDSLMTLNKDERKKRIHVANLKTLGKSFSVVAARLMISEFIKQ